jgi:hypothetical protein
MHPEDTHDNTDHVSDDDLVLRWLDDPSRQPPWQLIAAEFSARWRMGTVGMLAEAVEKALKLPVKMPTVETANLMNDDNVDRPMLDAYAALIAHSQKMIANKWSGFDRISVSVDSLELMVKLARVGARMQSIGAQVAKRAAETRGAPPKTPRSDAEVVARAAELVDTMSMPMLNTEFRRLVELAGERVASVKVTKLAPRLCDCELRNRAWDGNTGKCGTCGARFPR